MSSSYDSCIEQLLFFLEKAKEWRAKNTLLNPSANPEVEIVFSPSWQYTAFKVSGKQRLVFNAHHLLEDYIRFGANHELRDRIGKYLSEGSPDLSLRFSLLSLALEAWRKQYEKNDREKCIPFSIAIKLLESCHFDERYTLPTHHDELYPFFVVRESIGYALRDKILRKMETSKIRAKFEQVLKECMILVTEESGKAPSVISYKRASELKIILSHMVASGAHTKLPTLIQEAKTFEELVEELHAKERKKGNYIG